MSESGSADEPRTLRRRLPREDRRRLAAANEQEWLAFPGLPGTHLTWRKSGSGNWDLVSAEGAIWATRRGKSVVASDRIYEICRIRTNDSFINPRYRTELVDSAGSAVFSWTGTHSAGRARTVLSLRGVDDEFPLRGSMYKTKTVMSAVETGEPGHPLVNFDDLGLVSGGAELELLSPSISRSRGESWFPDDPTDGIGDRRRVVLVAELLPR